MNLREIPAEDRSLTYDYYTTFRDGFSHQYEFHAVTSDVVNPRESGTLRELARILEVDSSHSPLFDALKFSEGLRVKSITPAGVYATAFLEGHHPSDVIAVEVFHELAIVRGEHGFRRSRLCVGGEEGDAVYTAIMRTKKPLRNEQLEVVDGAFSDALGKVELLRD